jgi:hypothetical protein
VVTFPKNISIGTKNNSLKGKAIKIALAVPDRKAMGNIAPARNEEIQLINPICAYWSPK